MWSKDTTSEDYSKMVERSKSKLNTEEEPEEEEKDEGEKEEAVVQAEENLGLLKFDQTYK